MTTHEQTTQEMRDAFDALCKSRVKAAVDAEREACAKVCDEMEFNYWHSIEDENNFTPIDCAKAIRARG